MLNDIFKSGRVGKKLKTKDCDKTENWGGTFHQPSKMKLMLEQKKQEGSLKLLVWVT